MSAHKLAIVHLTTTRS